MLCLDVRRREIAISEIRNGQLNYLGAASSFIENWSEIEVDQLIGAIDEILAGKEIYDENCLVLLHAELATVAEVSLPFISERDMRNVVRFEVKKISHKALPDLAYHYKLLEKPASRGSRVKVKITVVEGSQIRFFAGIGKAFGLRLVSLKVVPDDFAGGLDPTYAKAVLQKSKEREDYFRKLKFWQQPEFWYKLLVVLWAFYLLGFLGILWKFHVGIGEAGERAALFNAQAGSVQEEISGLAAAQNDTSSFYLNAVRWIKENVPQGIWLGQLTINSGAFEIVGWGNSPENVQAFLDTLGSTYQTSVISKEWDDTLYKFRAVAAGKQ